MPRLMVRELTVAPKAPQFNKSLVSFSVKASDQAHARTSEREYADDVNGRDAYRRVARVSTTSHPVTTNARIS